MDNNENKLFSAIRLLFPYYTLLLALLLVDYFVFSHYFFNDIFAAFWIFVFLILEVMFVLDLMIKRRAINLYNRWVASTVSAVFVISLLAAMWGSYKNWGVTVWLMLAIVSGVLIFIKKENMPNRFAGASFYWFFNSRFRRFCFLFLITAAIFAMIYFRSNHLGLAVIPITVIGGLVSFVILWYVVGDFIR